LHHFPVRSAGLLSLYPYGGFSDFVDGERSAITAAKP
jgi:hypothetical protein